MPQAILLRFSWQKQRYLYLTLAFAACYFLLHFFLRLWVSPSLERDEAEQVVLAQHFAFGYTTQPPLYTWLQSLVFSLFGIHIAALIFLKNLLLFLFVIFFFIIAKETLLDEELAMFATSSLAFLPQIAWEGQRDLSHTVLATTVGAAGFVALFYFFRKPSLWRAIVFGLCLGLGLLSKYNIIFLQGGMVLAVLAIPRMRRLLRENLVYVKAIVGTAAIVVLPHLAWMLLYQFEGQALLAEVGLKNASPDYLKSILEALYTLFLFLTPFWFFFLISFFKRLRWQPAALNVALLAGAILGCFLLLTVFMMVAGMTSLKPRWLDPLFFAMPIVFFAFVAKPLPRWSKKIYLGLFALTVTGYLIGMPLRVVLSQSHGHFEELNAPMDTWAQAIAKAGFQHGVIIAESQWLAGGLKIYFPKSKAYAVWADFKIEQVPQILVVWQNQLPEKLVKQIGQMGYVLEKPHYIEAPLLYGKGSMTLGMAFAKNE